MVAEEGTSLPELPSAVRRVEVPADLLRSLSTTETPQGVLFLCRTPDLALPERLTGGRYMVVNLLLLGLMLSAFREERLPQGQKGPAAQSSRGRPLISWRDGDLVIALGRRTGK